MWSDFHCLCLLLFRLQIPETVAFPKRSTFFVDSIFRHFPITYSYKVGDVMSVIEILIVSVGLSLDVFVAMAYLGAGFSYINKRNLAGLSVLFGGMQFLEIVAGNVITMFLPLGQTRTGDVADEWEALTAFIFAGLGIYMICKGLRREEVLERRKDNVDWNRMIPLSVVTGIDALFAGAGMSFLGTDIFVQSVVLLPVGVCMAILGIYVGYRLGLEHNRHALWIGGALLLIASGDVMIHYYL